MPPLKNARHERFAQELAKGKTQEQAYIDAGYIGNKTAASRLAQDVNVCKRFEEIKERGAIRAEITISSIVAELEEARLAAYGAETVQASAMVSASLAKAKLLGLEPPTKSENTNRLLIITKDDEAL